MHTLGVISMMMPSEQSTRGQYYLFISFQVTFLTIYSSNQSLSETFLRVTDLHSSVPDAVTPFLDVIYEGRAVPVHVSPERKHMPVQFKGKQLKFYVVTSK